MLATLAGSHRCHLAECPRLHANRQSCTLAACHGSYGVSHPCHGAFYGEKSFYYNLYWSKMRTLRRYANPDLCVCVCYCMSLCISRDTLHTRSCLSSSHFMPDIIPRRIPKAVQSTSITPTPSFLITYIRRETGGAPCVSIWLDLDEKKALIRWWEQTCCQLTGSLAVTWSPYNPQPC